MTWKINFRCHPWINKEDAERAIHARLDESRKRRKQSVSEEVILQDWVIASLVNDQGLSTAAKSFWERLARAMVKGKSQTWDPIDIFILQNWRELRIKPEFTAKCGELPGLQDWSPKAIAGLFTYAGLYDDESNSKSFEEWFRKRRKRLGLPDKNRYEIKDFIVNNDTLRVVR
jgi:hypothetical protein